MNTEMINIDIALLIIIGILLFELIIFLHEGGHFVAAKLSGVKVNEFALGMGPKLIKFKKGETLYSLRLFPIGGFCAMEGEDGDSDDDRAFGNKAVWKRMIIVLAGAFMNIVLGLVLMMITLAPSERFASSTVAEFTENATSSQQLKVGDTIKKINGYGILTSTDLSFAFATAESNELNMTVERNGQTVYLDKVVLPKTKNSDGKEILQLDFRVYGIENNFGNLLSQTFLSTVSTVKVVWASLAGLVTGKFSFNVVAGPVGMTSTISQATAQGLERSFMDGLMNLIYVMTIITINLGVVNLLPLPALDGGRFVFLVVEAIRRKKINQTVEGYIHAAGMILLLLFMAAITVKDIIQLIF